MASTESRVAVQPGVLPLDSAEAEFRYLSTRSSLRLLGDWLLDEQTLLKLRRLNEHWRFESPARGWLTISAFADSFTTSAIGTQLLAEISIWNREKEHGSVAGPTCGVHLPDGAILFPHGLWVSKVRQASQPEDYDGILLGVCPEFVLELCSSYDGIAERQHRMMQWIAHGASLCWLVDIAERTVWIYRPDSDPEQVTKPSELGGESVCEGLVVNLAQFWESSK